MPTLDSKEILSLSAPAILIVWTLREVFSYLLKSQHQRKDQCETDYRNAREDALLPVLKTLTENLQKQTDVLNEIYLELRENSVRLKVLDDRVSKGNPTSN